jgi:hypothetical protein
MKKINPPLFYFPSHLSNLCYPLVNGGLGNHGGHSFSELYRRFDSRRYPQMINGVDVNRMTPEQIYDYFVSTHTPHHLRLTSKSNSTRSRSKIMWSRRSPTLRYTSTGNKRGKKRRRRRAATRRIASASCATKTTRRGKQ